MSTAAEAPQVEEHAEGLEDEHADHLTPANYWRIAVFLAVVTAVEVAITYIPGFDGAILVTSLIVLGLGGDSTATWMLPSRTSTS